MATRRPGPIGWLFIAAIALILVGVARTADLGGGDGDRRVALWGDSLAWEAQNAFRSTVQAAGGETMVHTYGGTAPCDWLADIRKQSRRWRPDVAVLAFSGNTGSPCMEGRELADAYREDITAAVARLTRAGAHVLLVEAPPRTDQPVDAEGRTELDRVWHEIAADLPDTAVIPAGRAVTTADGRWTATLPCAAAEPCGPGGAVTVRSPDGVHLCPVQVAPMTQCPVSSPGANRYGRAMADAAVTALGPAPSTGPPASAGGS
ncbi:DUF459 domain-containing protein [Frankia nepalensis]|uniref:SGNH hydrolase-type esterase domain-containing protein n=1 Tax=Frankia nepalensis TaxID=1836974 RepID=A0A937RG44_9ACTN|nr:SGNH hydrolase domain-containing protein [Frankia nepalensis]MBL7501907.1 hypothetical protein [Frankia nepalensis]MBL7513912.1 hypothetical protein [Frankia nepalensis]MBL7629572.1 hypothetical protein [Frankia nepalensis]